MHLQELQINTFSQRFQNCFSVSYRLLNGLNGVKIENQGKQSMLIFFNVSEEDYGNYTCVAMNTMGITNASIILYGKKNMLQLCCSLQWIKEKRKKFCFCQRPLLPYYMCTATHKKAILKVTHCMLFMELPFISTDCQFPWQFQHQTAWTFKF